MPRIKEVSAEELAKLIHHYHEALAPDFGCQPGKQASPSWEFTAQNERKLLVATARLVLLDLSKSHDNNVEATNNGRRSSPWTVSPSQEKGTNGARELASYQAGREGRECGC